MKDNRVGEINVNKHGSKMVIEKYNNARDMWVRFVDSGYLVNTRYEKFKSGGVKNVYDKTVLGIGFIGEGNYKVSENLVMTPQYMAWNSMISRCYSQSYQDKRPSYIGCSVANEWHNFQNFAKWYDENYYEIEGQRMNLDKDILQKGNKAYSPDTCVFVPSFINNLFIKSDHNRGEFPIGVSYSSKYKKYQVSCATNGKSKLLGRFNTIEEAFFAYKTYKEELIKQIANEYKNQIPIELYNTLINYIVEIDD
jgi:hypothetical protein